MRYCTNCGHDSPPEALYCPSCGTRLPAGGVAERQQSQYGGDLTLPAPPYSTEPSKGPEPSGQPYYIPPARQDGKPGGGSISLALISLIFSVLLRPTFAYPVIIYSIYHSTRELKEGLTTRTTARTMSIIALALAVLSNIANIALSMMGVTLGEFIGTF